MRRLIYAVVGVFLLVSVAEGQVFEPGRITLFSDSSFDKPYFYDNYFGGTRYFYVIHMGGSQVSGCRFSVQLGNGFGCMHLDESSIFATTGDVLTGITVDYGDCLSGSILVTTIMFYCTGTTKECSLVWTAADPVAPSGYIEAVACGGGKYEAGDGYVVCNPVQDCLVNPVKMTTWGQLKSLYH